MGLYDVFNDNDAEIICNHCGHQLNIQNGIQSKRFTDSLTTFHPGDVIPSLNSNKVGVYSIEEFEWCSNCNESTTVFFAFNNSIFVGLSSSQEKALEKASNFDLFSQYKIMNAAYHNVNHELEQMKYKIDSTIEFFTSKPVKNKFSLLYMSPNKKFLDYDIIKTLKNIIKN